MQNMTNMIDLILQNLSSERTTEGFASPDSVIEVVWSKETESESEKLLATKKNKHNAVMNKEGVGVGTVVTITGREGKKKHITGNLSFMSENKRGLKVDRRDFDEVTVRVKDANHLKGPEVDTVKFSSTLHLQIFYVFRFTLSLFGLYFVIGSNIFGQEALKDISSRVLSQSDFVSC